MTFKGKVILLILFLIAAISGMYLMSKLLFKHEVTVNYQNINYVAVYKTSSLDEVDPSPIVEVEFSGEVIKLESGDYSFYYKGKKGFDTKYIEKTITEDSVVNLKPNYSEETERLMVSKEIPAIKDLLAKKYPRISLYKLTGSQLYEEGKWFGGVLEYQGEDILNGDDIRFIMRKQASQWTLITDPPSIMISKKDYVDSDIPDSVIDAVNEL